MLEVCGNCHIGGVSQQPGPEKPPKDMLGIKGDYGVLLIIGKTLMYVELIWT